mgnify:CR=1 FL=1
MGSLPNDSLPLHDGSRMLILDCGSQFTQLIARRIREANVYSEIHPAVSYTHLTLPTNREV